MKRSAGLLFALLCFRMPPAAADAGLPALSAAPAGAGLAAQKPEPALYEITAADTQAAAFVPALQRELELRFAVYNRLFRFEPLGLAAPLKVRLFTDRSAYDRYVAERLALPLPPEEGLPAAVYLHYSVPEKRELVLCQGSPGEEALRSHQAFVQFLRAFVPHPPSWMREGFAIYFATLRFNPRGEGSLEYEENLLYLESVKALGRQLPLPQALLRADLDGAPEELQISSWALVSFLLNSGGDYFRSLTEAFMVLSPSGSAAENGELVLGRFFPWLDQAVMAEDFRAYLDSRKTFGELMEDGRRAYSLKDALNAELAFMTARDQRPADFAPYYYLGLLAYEEKSYALAETYYQSSLERGADEALVNYALGINAAAAGRPADAAAYLEKAAAADPPQYRAKVTDLLRRLNP
jgi:hypothetical protein